MNEFNFKDLKTQVSSDSITVKWRVATDIPSEKVSYEAILVEEKDDGRFEISDLLQKTDTYTFANLDAHSEYTLYVRAYEEPDHAFIVEYPQGGLRAKTLDKEGPDTGSSPSLRSKVLHVSYITGDSFRVLWEYAKDALSNDWGNLYRIYLKEADEPDSAWRIVEELPGRLGIQTGVASITNLKPGIQYVFYVEASNEKGETIKYNEGKAKTHDIVDKKPPTTKDITLTVSDITSDGFMVKWNKATDNVTPQEKILYELIVIEHEEKDRSKWKKAASERNIDSARVTGLKPATKYDVWVNAKDDAHYTLSYQRIVVETLDNLDSEAPAVNNRRMKVSHISNFGFTLAWEKARSSYTEKDRIRYVIRIKENDGASDERVANEAYGIGSYTFLDLDGGKEYKCSLKAVNEKGDALEYDPVVVSLPSVENRKWSLPESIILSRQDNVYSDGVYSGIDFDYGKTALFEELGKNFNERCFEVSFEFFILPENLEGTRDWDLGDDDNALVSLGSNPTGLIISLTEDYTVRVLAETQEYQITQPFLTPLRFKKEVWQPFKLLYSDGCLLLNDEILLPIGKFQDFNKVITSVDFYYGSCFIGYIRNLVVKSR